MKKAYNGDPDACCPFMGGKKCSKVCPTCGLYSHIRGINLNTNLEVDRWDCALSSLVTLAIENSYRQLQTSAAVESFRNEMVSMNALALVAKVAPLALTSRAQESLPPPSE
jgi:hypothetical protein